MHEYYVTQQLIKIAEDELKEIKPKKVLSIKVVVGELSGIIDESLKFYFDILTKGTILEGSKLEIVQKKALLFCNSCQSLFERTKDFLCPKCKSLGKLTEYGREFYIESIEVDDGDGN
ncbi:hydrogenase maturation nickel metallochaperone HypA [Caldicellulosiruptor naganoensis]|uniref:Hydrogenase maturation factor HypA n=1 Tax=Caldicellulosiruptor naganoensis TaxID=29324 RepID=A0ABY7BEV0_9FIRM|nr:hydrogenase maturation nickel metallochaperone HypA [Caldicellulosiruptor naganoensis]WAM30943.1 hydrogenase maturation nickel metallochaperone HypA [Caldicellulosiruptor naganoensis]